ncbi:DNA alkylation repair protein [Candidatus Gracilibacteria bacterium]|nr:DNA alkylation repair protein [Candidatus Gracilibacteria bacterium]
MTISKIKRGLRLYKTKERAEVNAWFFKTGKGQYGEGDIFLGVTVPDIRKVVKSFFSELTLNDAVELLQSKYHEDRLAGCILMVELFKIATKNNSIKEQKKIYTTYLNSTSRINNWDLVDLSCKDIVGEYLYKVRPCIVVLYKLAKSKSLWERRIAIVSTFAFIKKGEHKDTFAICEVLMNDKEDLMHKACGWMLREVGKNCGIETLNIFLEKYATKMPRTMLRYAIERHHPVERVKILRKSK